MKTSEKLYRTFKIITYPKSKTGLYDSHIFKKGEFTSFDHVKMPLKKDSISNAKSMIDSGIEFGYLREAI